MTRLTEESHVCPLYSILLTHNLDLESLLLGVSSTGDRLGPLWW